MTKLVHKPPIKRSDTPCYYTFIYTGGTRGRTRTGTAVKPEDFKSSMSTIPSRGHSGEHRQNAGRVKADYL